MLTGEIVIFFGHTFIKNENIYHIQNIQSITQTPPNSLLFVKFKKENLELIEHLQLNNMRYALEVDSILEATYGEALGANYIVVQKHIAKKVQDVAQNYLFSAKVLVHVDSESEITNHIEQEIDGVIFSDAIVKII